MSDKHPTRTQIVGGVVSGLVVAAVLRLTPAAWAVTKAILGWIWGVITTPVPLLALILTGVLGWLVARRWWRPRLVAQIVAVSASPELREVPDELGEAVIRQLAINDGPASSLKHLSARLEQPKLLVHQAVERLERLDLVAEQFSPVSGTAIALTSRGRDHAIQQGYVAARKPPL